MSVFSCLSLTCGLGGWDIPWVCTACSRILSPFSSTRVLFRVMSVVLLVPPVTVLLYCCMYLAHWCSGVVHGRFLTNSGILARFCCLRHERNRHNFLTSYPPPLPHPMCVCSVTAILCGAFVSYHAMPWAGCRCTTRRRSFSSFGWPCPDTRYT